MLIGELAKQSGFTKDTLRYYERIGLIQLVEVQRGENNYRRYERDILQDLSNIKKLKEAGFTLAEIKQFRGMNQLDLLNCEALAPIIKRKIEKIEQEIKLLTAQRNKLITLGQTCEGDCSSTFQKS